MISGSTHARNVDGAKEFLYGISTIINTVIINTVAIIIPSFPFFPVISAQNNLIFFFSNSDIKQNFIL